MAKNDATRMLTKGAGRKPPNPEGRAVIVTASVPNGLVAKLDVLTVENEQNRSAVVTVIRQLVSAK